jgi:queuosine precursor transporter
MFDKRVISLALAHIIIITCCNYLVTLPFAIAGIKLNPGVFLYPLIYLTTDLTTRLLGKQLARHVIGWAFVPSSITTFFILWSLEPVSVALRVAAASGTSYLFALFLDVGVFSYLRDRFQAWWVAPAFSTIFTMCLQTYYFYFTGFYAGDNAYMAENWHVIATNQFLVKSIIMTGIVVPLYGFLMNQIQRRYHIT